MKTIKMNNNNSQDRQHNKDVFFLGLMYSKQTLEDAKEDSKAGIQMAPHIFSKIFLKDLQKERMLISVFFTCRQ